MQGLYSTVDGAVPILFLSHYVSLLYFYFYVILNVDLLNIVLI